MQDSKSLSRIFVNSGLGSVVATNIVTTSPTSSPPAAATSAAKRRFNGGQLAGIVIGCVVGVSLLYLAAYGALVMYQKKQQKAAGKGSEPSSQANGEYAPMNAPAATSKSSKHPSWLPAFLKPKQGAAAAGKDEKATLATADSQAGASATSLTASVP